MIELRINRAELARIEHNVTHSIKMIEAMKKVGIPVSGVLITHGIEHGRMVWGNDGGDHVIRWYAQDESEHSQRTVGSTGSGPGYRWTKYVEADDGDEL